MHTSAARTETDAETSEWRRGREAELAGARILACPYPDGAQVRRWRADWMTSSRTAPWRYASGSGGHTSRFKEPPPLHIEPGLPAAVTAARVSLRSEECPVCGTTKVQDAMLCVRCRGALPHGALLVAIGVQTHQDPP